MDKEQYQLLYNLEERHWWYLGMRRVVDSVLRPHLPTARPLRVLDAGCGTGGMLSYLRSLGPAVGVDLSEEAIALSRRRHSCGLARASVECLPFLGGSFDLVVSLDVLYHLDVGDDRKALREFRRVLRPGGLLLIRLPAYNWLRGAHDTAVHTRHRYSSGELSSKMVEAGFRIRRLTYVNSLLFPVAALKRLLEGTRHTFRPDLDLPPPWINRTLRAALDLEARAVGLVSLPLGLSVLGLAERSD